jgi:hypothetical protein
MKHKKNVTSSLEDRPNLQEFNLKKSVLHFQRFRSYKFFNEAPQPRPFAKKMARSKVLTKGRSKLKIQRRIETCNQNEAFPFKKTNMAPTSGTSESVVILKIFYLNLEESIIVGYQFSYSYDFGKSESY